MGAATRISKGCPTNVRTIQPVAATAANSVFCVPVPGMNERLLEATTECKLHFVTTPLPTHAVPRVYHLRAEEKATYSSWLEKRLNDGNVRRLRPDETPAFYTPHFPCSKDKSRIVGDFKELNKFLLPLTDHTSHIDAVRTWVQQHKFCSKFDLSSAFYNVPTNTASQRYLCFIGPDGHTYTYLGMPVGLCIGSAVFTQWLSNKLYKVLPEQAIRLYQDDIFVAARSAAELRQYEQQLLPALSRMRLKINLAKTQTAVTGMNVLGLHYKDGKFTIPPLAAAALLSPLRHVAECKTTTKRILYRILGKINLFRSLSAKATALIRPLYDVTKTVASWSEPIIVSGVLRNQFLYIATTIPTWTTSTADSVPVLTYFVDSSNTGMGVAVTDTTGSEIHNWSATHYTTNTDAAYKELGGLLHFLRANQPFLYGSTGAPPSRIYYGRSFRSMRSMTMKYNSTMWQGAIMIVLMH
eukprot:Lankesteria_metandrocarpae@DN5035_c0_g1_i2.p1